MDKPFSKWYCDVCGKEIIDEKKGYVIWRFENHKSYDFKIIHQKDCELKDHSSSAALTEFLGENGLTYLLSKLSFGPIKRQIGEDSQCQIVNFDEFVDFVRRLQIPYYEEARKYFKSEKTISYYYDNDEISPYEPEQLKAIISSNCSR